jgi:oligoribonuclease
VPAGVPRRVDRVTDRLVWIDCEMTGLDLGSDLLIEVAALVTDSELNVLGEGIDVVIGATADELARMPDVVRDMHASSGLTEEVIRATVTVQEAEQQVLAYLKEHVEPHKAPLCGNSIATDRGFLARDMHELDEFLHYRMVDVSSVKELARRWYPRAYFNSPKKAGGHRALADIHESVKELRYYRSTVFVPQPGPSSEEAAAAAAALDPPAPG